jgi:hypothetical protein
VQGLSFARQTRSGWEVELVRAGQLWQPAAALDDTDTVRLVFYDATIGALFYAQEGGRGSWLFQTVEDDPSGDIRIGRQPSLALDAFGRTHLSYYLGDRFKGAALKYAVSTGARSGTSPVPATEADHQRWVGAPVWRPRGGSPVSEQHVARPKDAAARRWVVHA